MSFCLKNIQPCQKVDHYSELKELKTDDGSRVHGFIPSSKQNMLSKTKCLAFTNDCRWFRNLKASVSLFVSVVKISIDIDIFRQLFACERNNGFDIFLTPVCKCEEEVGR